ncbi:MAG: hypothetical protein NMNS01_12060 [Nitrosomonas sp.]|nr:MAG: hypothetical protein NMNS01_12060 [Nitrosomonas sp.]
MIMSDKEYAASMEQLTMLQESLSEENYKNVPKIVKNASKEQVKSLMADIQTKIVEYEKFKLSKL